MVRKRKFVEFERDVDDEISRVEPPPLELKEEDVVEENEEDDETDEEEEEEAWQAFREEYHDSESSLEWFILVEFGDLSRVGTSS
jgi:hypothetical protein